VVKDERREIGRSSQGAGCQLYISRAL
jgi:hypothetical protein